MCQVKEEIYLLGYVNSMLLNFDPHKSFKWKCLIMINDMVCVLLQLLQKEKPKRLGCKNDFQEIRNHSFFASIDWKALDKKKLTPPYNPNTVSIDLSLNHKFKTVLIPHYGLQQRFFNMPYIYMYLYVQYNITHLHDIVATCIWSYVLLLSFVL